MKVKSLSLRGICKPYRRAEPTTLDLAALGPGLIALTGPNGGGKTALVETLPAALYQKLPYRSPRSIYEYAAGRDAFAEAVHEDAGREIRVVSRFDAERRECERSLSIDGVSVASGKAAFDAKVRELFGSYDLFLATVLSCQSRQGNLCEVPVAARKALFAELLGLARYAEIAGRAKERREAVERAVSDLRREVAAVELEIRGIPAAEAESERAGQDAFVEATLLEDYREMEADASRRLGLARSAADRIAPLEAALAAAQREVDAAEKAVHEAETLPEKARRTLEDKLRFIASGKAEELEGKARARHRAAVDRIGQRRIGLQAEIDRAGDVDTDAIRGRLDSIRLERGSLDAEERGRQDTEGRERVAAAEVQAARKALAVAERDYRAETSRLGDQAKMLERAPCAQAPGWYYLEPDEKSDGTILGERVEIDLAGACPLLASAREAATTIAGRDVEAGTAEARQRLREAEEALTTRVAQQAPYRDLSVISEDKTALERETKALQDQLGDVGAAEQARAQLVGLTTEMETAGVILSADLQEADRAVHEAEEARGRAQADHDKAIYEAETALTKARLTADDAFAYRTDAEATLQEAKEQLGDAGVPAAERALAEATAARKAAEAALRNADQAVATARATLDALRAKEAALQPKRDQLAGEETALGDWRLLEEAFGKDGIPQLRIDAAGPEVSALATEILRVSWGMRFSISIETQRELVSREGTAEAFAIVVMDGGERREVEDLSGGERVVVHEAISLACAIYNRRKSGIDWRTLFRDETAGALDHDHARQYVPMLARARELGGFEQIVFVSHNPEVVAAADVVIQVEDGRLTVAGAEAAA